LDGIGKYPKYKNGIQILVPVPDMSQPFTDLVTSLQNHNIKTSVSEAFDTSKFFSPCLVTPSQTS
jgi:hypothetical protein